MSNELQATLFDYATLPSGEAVEIRAAAERIKVRLKRTAEDIIEIGRDLIAVKAKLGHGNFEGWLKAEFDFSQKHATRFIQVAEKFGNTKSDIMSDFKPTILYALAAPSTPPEVITQAIEKAEAGEKVTAAEVEKWKQAALESAKEAKGLKQQVMELTEDYETLREREERTRQELANRPTTAKIVEKVVEVEKIVTRAPADYEQLQRKAAKLDELRDDLAAANQALVNLKAEQARKIEEGTRQALRQSQAEVTEFERRKTELERMIEARRRELMEFDSDRTANADMTAALGEFALAVGGLSARLSSFEIQAMHPKTRGELDRVDYLLVECLELVTKLRQVPLYDPASDASVVAQEAT